MSILEKLQHIKKQLPEHVTLVAVSKTKTVQTILGAYNAGQRIFGENKIQEMVGKHDALPKDIKWHMIGHLQRNKVKYMAHFVDLIHGVDSFKTLKEINKQAKKHNRIINCLLQVKIAQEDTKYGIAFSDIEKIITSDELKELENITIVGFMGMASFTDDIEQVKHEFSSLHSFFQQQRAQHANLNTLSIGMSGDYVTAVECGSTMVRIGSAIFGAR